MTCEFTTIAIQGEVIVAERLPKRVDTWQDKKAVLLSRVDQQSQLCDDLFEAAQALASQRHQPEAPPSPTDALESFVTHDRCVEGLTCGDYCAAVLRQNVDAFAACTCLKKRP